MKDCDDTNANVYPGKAESCNNVDDDCDGSVDEGLSATDTECGTGECYSTGTLSCVSGSWVDSCTPGAPGTEVCDAEEKDEDCDGKTGADEGCGSECFAGDIQDCPKQDGVCENSTQQCSNGYWADCDYSLNSDDYEAVESECDGLDNDCDGSVDEGCDVLTCDDCLALDYYDCMDSDVCYAVSGLDGEGSWCLKKGMVWDGECVDAQACVDNDIEDDEYFRGSVTAHRGYAPQIMTEYYDECSTLVFVGESQLFQKSCLTENGVEFARDVSSWCFDPDQDVVSYDSNRIYTDKAVCSNGRCVDCPDEGKTCSGASDCNLDGEGKYTLYGGTPDDASVSCVRMHCDNDHCCPIGYVWSGVSCEPSGGPSNCEECMQTYENQEEACISDANCWWYYGESKCLKKGMVWDEGQCVDALGCTDHDGDDEFTKGGCTGYIDYEVSPIEYGLREDSCFPPTEPIHVEGVFEVMCGFNAGVGFEITWEEGQTCPEGYICRDGACVVPITNCDGCMTMDGDETLCGGYSECYYNYTQGKCLLDGYWWDSNYGKCCPDGTHWSTMNEECVANPTECYEETNPLKCNSLPPNDPLGLGAGYWIDAGCIQGIDACCYYPYPEWYGGDGYGIKEILVWN